MGATSLSTRAISSTANATAILSLAAVLAAWPAGAADGPKAELKYALIVSRHGVRSPTWDAARLAEYSTEAWPDWGVGPGELTPHGREGAKLLGAYYRAWLSKAGLFEGQRLPRRLANLHSRRRRPAYARDRTRVRRISAAGL